MTTTKLFKRHKLIRSTLMLLVAMFAAQGAWANDLYVGDQKIDVSDASAIAAFNAAHSDVEVVVADYSGVTVVEVALNGYKYEGKQFDDRAVIQLQVHDDTPILHLSLEGKNSIKLNGNNGVSSVRSASAVAAKNIYVSGTGSLDIDLDENCEANQVCGINAKELFLACGDRAIKLGMSGALGGDAIDIPEGLELPEFHGQMTISNRANAGEVCGISSPVGAVLGSGDIDILTSGSASQISGVKARARVAVYDSNVTVNSTGYGIATESLLVGETDFLVEAQKGVNDETLAMFLFTPIAVTGAFNGAVSIHAEWKNASGVLSHNKTTSLTLVNVPSTSKYAHFYLTLDDGKPFSTEEDVHVPTLMYIRHIVKDGGKYSFFVPFDIPAEQTKDLGAFYKFDRYEDGKAYFIEEKEGVKANIPYFLDPARDIDTIIVKNPTLKAYTSTANAAAPVEPGLYGTYQKITVPTGAYGYANVDEEDFYGEEKFFVRAGTGDQIIPERAYLWLGSNVSLAKVMSVFSSGDDEDNTMVGSIAEVDGSNSNDPVFNLNGQRMAAPRSGEIYIQNGKKFIRK